MFRHSKISIDFLEILKGKLYKNEYLVINGESVKITSQRYEVFKKSVVCVKCGIVGSFLALEKGNEEDGHYHLNLYAINEDGEEILMTKDHIIPKSKGGKNYISNYQTMCTVCNREKGNNDEN